MTLALGVLIFFIVLLICCSAFFSGSETALTAVSRARLMSYERNGDKRATIVQKLVEKNDRLIGALLIGNNLVNILASSLATTAFLGIFGQSGVVYATVAMTILVVIFAEVLPKSAAIASPDGFALKVARAVSIVVATLGPLTRIVNWIVRKLLFLLGAGRDSSASLLTAHEELRGAVEVLHREGSLVNADRNRLGGLLDLHELEVSDVMVHRTGMRQVNAEDPPAEIVKQILESPYTRMPIWRGHYDNIVGIVHAKDLLRALHDVENDPGKIDILKVCTSPWFVPETTTLQDQLNAFLRRKTHFAIVVDEYGEVEGLITLEDILEEIVGNIADEHDLEMQGVTTEADGSVVVDGQVPIRDLNRALDWNLPDEEAVTIAGLVIHETGTIPEERQAFTFFQKRFTVLKRDKNRIAKLRIRPAQVLVPPKKGALAALAVGAAQSPEQSKLEEADMFEADSFDDADDEAAANAPEEARHEADVERDRRSDVPRERGGD
ncbi:putative hemolysin protein [Fulvimarina pelagi HTCC2506]|uniref:Putative hemolysin protein n=1 Tax=Fulvimarina pelagi HTCC2506 TaxID=314231 RepID=Q0G505_9HYPH|nr:HlyC/CorC family transporter [Fulvimarina pelagi]EAU43259.1 putative hemolysin protein [Fulvimarina pelagi HTCC2506]